MSEKTFRIRLEHITRVEGHGSIRIDTNKGRVEEVRLEIVEANRFFENLVKGTRWYRPFRESVGSAVSVINWRR